MPCELNKMTMKIDFYLGRKLRRLEKKMEKSSEDLNVREWQYDQQDPYEAANRRQNKKKTNGQEATTGLTESLLKQIFPS
jgi:hypothetical protein